MKSKNRIAWKTFAPFCDLKKPTKKVHGRPAKDKRSKRLKDEEGRREKKMTKNFNNMGGRK